MWFWSTNWRYKFGGMPKTKPPELPPPVATPTEIAPMAMKAGEAERRRLRGRRGRIGTIFAGRRPLPAATTAQAGLKTTLG